MSFLKKKKKLIIIITMYVNYVYLYYPTSPILSSSTFFCNASMLIKKFEKRKKKKKKKKEKESVALLLFLSSLLLIFLNVQLFKTSLFPTFSYSFQKISMYKYNLVHFQQKFFSKKLDKLFPNGHHHIHDQSRNQYLSQQKGAIFKIFTKPEACLQNLGIFKGLDRVMGS